MPNSCPARSTAGYGSCAVGFVGGFGRNANGSQLACSPPSAGQPGPSSRVAPVRGRSFHLWCHQREKTLTGFGGGERSPAEAFNRRSAAEAVRRSWVAAKRSPRFGWQ
jgi:hypothetical protein